MPFMRPQEIHPALVHFPIALLPLAAAADGLGLLRRDRELLRLGRLATALAAAAGVVTGAAGFLAQEEAHAEGEARTMLRTHRNVNVVTVAAAVGLAIWRWGRRAPTPASLALLGGALGAVAYSAWLGGHLVYEHGVGVVRAGGARLDRRHRLPPPSPDAVSPFAFAGDGDRA